MGGLGDPEGPGRPADPYAVFEDLRQASEGGPADYLGVTWERIAAEDKVFWPCPGDGIKQGNPLRLRHDLRKGPMTDGKGFPQKRHRASSMACVPSGILMGCSGWFTDGVDASPSPPG